MCYKEERLLSLKYAQQEFAEKIPKHPQKLKPSGNIVGLHYQSPYHYKNLANRIEYLYDSLPLHSEHTRFNTFYKAIKPSFSEYSAKMELLETDNTGLRGYSWQKSSEGLYHEFVYRIPKASSSKSIWGLKFGADRNKILQEAKGRLTKNLSFFIIFICCAIGLLWVIYFVLSALIRRVFFQGFSESMPSEITSVSISDTVPNEGNIFLFGPSGTGKFTAIKEYSKTAVLKMIDLDLARLTDKDAGTILRQIRDQIKETGMPPEKIILVLQNIESNLHDASITEKKLELMEGLLRKRCRIVVLSSRSFNALPIRYYFIGKPEFKDFTMRWSNILNNFYTIYHKWKKTGVSNHAQVELEAIRSVCDKIRGKIPPGQMQSMAPFLKEQAENLIKRIKEECAHSDLLWALVEPLLKQLKTIDPSHMSTVQNSTGEHLVKRAITHQMDIMFEVITTKLGSLAQNYYLSIWESLSRDEQRTLYDIALDELVNPANRNLAARLEELGLVRRAQYLACYFPMNRSFKDFILTHVTNYEITSFQDEVAQKGFWRSFQLPLIIVVIAVALFLFFTQRDAFDNLIAYVGAAIAGISALLRFLAMIPSSKST